VLEPRIKHRKDFYYNNIVGFFANLSTNPIDTMVYVPELSDITISTNVVCDQAIPQPNEEYHQALCSVIVEEGKPMSLKQVERQILHQTYKDDEDGCF
jgi:hypothetical protein